MPDQTVNEKLRASLKTEEAELVRRLEELAIDGTGESEFDENFADSGQVAAELGENLALSASLRDQLEDVEGALVRLDDGSYGKCLECGTQITAARLDAMPATPYCINHA